MKIFISLVLLLVLLISLLFGVDESAMKLQDEALTRSFAAFGLAKALNAVISLLQGTELSITPVGIGLNFSVGEVLDPFNDMVERFSWVMLFASISLSVQKLLLVLSAKLFIQLALILSVLVTVSVLWIKKIQNDRLLGYAIKTLLFILLLRFSAVLFVYSSEFIYTSTLQVEYESATQVVKNTQEKLQELENTNTKVILSQENLGFFDGMGARYDKIVESFNISKKLQALESNIEEASLKIVTLITIFVVQSILLPLLYLWLMLASIKFIFKVDMKSVIQRQKILYNTPTR